MNRRGFDRINVHLSVKRQQLIRDWSLCKHFLPILYSGAWLVVVHRHGPFCTEALKHNKLQRHLSILGSTNTNYVCSGYHKRSILRVIELTTKTLFGWTGTPRYWIDRKAAAKRVRLFQVTSVVKVLTSTRTCKWFGQTLTDGVTCSQKKFSLNVNRMSKNSPKNFQQQLVSKENKIAWGFLKIIFYANT